MTTTPNYIPILDKSELVSLLKELLANEAEPDARTFLALKLLRLHFENELIHTQ